MSVGQAALDLASSSIMYREELESIASICGLRLIELLLLQLIYEANSACTTIVWKDSTGTACYFRTMDWELEFLKK